MFLLNPKKQVSARNEYVEMEMDLFQILQIRSNEIPFSIQLESALILQEKDFQ
jgi:hypothetical protein